MPKLVRVTRLSLFAALLLATVAQRTQAAWPHDPNNGNVGLCTSAGDQAYPTIVSDGAGGAIVTWQDFRGGNSDIYVQRVNVAGTPQWTVNGVALCTATGNQFGPAIASDGAGGAIVTWQDFRGGNYDICAQRVTAAGAPQWTANGVALCTAANAARLSSRVDRRGAPVEKEGRRNPNWRSGAPFPVSVDYLVPSFFSAASFSFDSCLWFMCSARIFLSSAT